MIDIAYFHWYLICTYDLTELSEAERQLLTVKMSKTKLAKAHEVQFASDGAMLTCIGAKKHNDCSFSVVGCISFCRQKLVLSRLYYSHEL